MQTMLLTDIFSVSNSKEIKMKKIIILILFLLSVESYVLADEMLAVQPNNGILGSYFNTRNQLNNLEAQRLAIEQQRMELAEEQQRMAFEDEQQRMALWEERQRIANEIYGRDSQK